MGKEVLRVIRVSQAEVERRVAQVNQAYLDQRVLMGYQGNQEEQEIEDWMDYLVHPAPKETKVFPALDDLAHRVPLVAEDLMAYQGKMDPRDRKATMVCLDSQECQDRRVCLAQEVAQEDRVWMDCQE